MFAPDHPIHFRDYFDLVIYKPPAFDGLACIFIVNTCGFARKTLAFWVDEGAAALEVDPDFILRSWRGRLASLLDVRLHWPRLAHSLAPGFLFNLARKVSPLKMPKNPRPRPPVWIDLEGAHNMRDLGGYSVGHGAYTRFGMTYRSDTLENLTDNDIAKIVGLGVKLVLDLRTHEEADASMERYKLARVVRYECIPAIPEGIMAARVFPVGDPIAIGDVYFENLMDCTQNWAAAFRLLAEVDAPAIVHCAAGRDRTGVMSAILLSSAGVSDEEIALDYTATSSRVRLLDEQMSRNPIYAANRTPKVDELTADAHSIYRFLDNVRNKFGSVPELITSLADNETLERLRERMTL